MEKKNRITIQFNHDQNVTKQVNKEPKFFSTSHSKSDSFHHQKDSFAREDFSTRKQSTTHSFNESFNNSFNESVNETSNNSLNHSLAHSLSHSSEDDREIELSFVQEKKANFSRQNKYRWSRAWRKSYKVILNVGAAIGVGILLGIMVLSIFSSLNKEIDPEAAAQKDVEQGMVNGPSTGIEGNEQASDEIPLLIPTGSLEDGILQLPGRSYYVIQAGAFSDIEAAKEILQNHQSAGYPGILLGDQAPYRFYIGVAPTKEEVNQIANVYKEQGIEIFVREHKRSDMVGQVHVDQEHTKLFPGLLSKGDQLVEQMCKITGQGIGSLDHQLSAKEWNQLQELHRAVLDEGRQVFSSWQGEGKKNGEQLLHHLTTGVNALETYRKQNHAVYLWQTQQAVLEYLKEYEKFVSAVQ